jgi:hypothetical protein
VIFLAIGLDQVHPVIIYPPRACLFARMNSLKAVASRHLKVEFPTISALCSVRKRKARWSRGYLRGCCWRSALTGRAVIPGPKVPGRSRLLVGRKAGEVRCGPSGEWGRAVDPEPLRPATI